MSWGITLNALEVSTEQFLSAFYDPDDIVYFRHFDDKKRGTDPGHNKECRMNNLMSILPVLRKENAADQGIYFVVNGGGQSDAAVKKAGRCRAQFMECDEIPLHDQLEQINSFMLEPSIVVKTRKSLHAYWILKNGNINHFREIQQGLVRQFNSDPVIVNESRVMRLPGFNHCKQDPIPVTVIHWRPDLKYTQLELAKALPKPEKKAERKRDQARAGQQIPEGQRVSALISLIGSLKHSNLSNEAIRSAIRAENETRCYPPLTDYELEREVFPAVERFPSEPMPKKKKYNTSLFCFFCLYCI